MTLVFRLEMMYPASVPDDNVAQEIIAFMSISQQQLLANVHLLLFQSLSERTNHMNKFQYQ
jgi:hypothetical protein